MEIKKNMIHCGDSYKLIQSVPDKSIDCIYTDIPYLIDKGGCGSSGISQSMKRLGNSIRDFSNGIDYSVFGEFKRVMKKINLFIWCSKNQIRDILNYWVDGGCYFEILTWNKTDPTPMCNNNWLPDVEYCLYFREKGVPLNDGYNLKSKFYVGQKNLKDKADYLHPTIKPFELVERHLLHATQPGDIILDPFVGSGTTAVACKKIGRDFIAFEIDPKYCEIATLRLEEKTLYEKSLEDKGFQTIFDYI